MLRQGGDLSRGAGTQTLDTEHAFSGLASSAVARQALGLPGLSSRDSVGLQPYLCVLWVRTTLSEAAKRQEGEREECESLQSVSLREFKLPGGGDAFQETRRGRKSRERDSN